MQADYIKELLNSLIHFYEATAKLFYILIQQYIIAMTGSNSKLVIGCIVSV